MEGASTTRHRHACCVLSVLCLVQTTPPFAYLNNRVIFTSLPQAGQLPSASFLVAVAVSLHVFSHGGLQVQMIAIMDANVDLYAKFTVPVSVCVSVFVSVCVSVCVSVSVSVCQCLY